MPPMGSAITILLAFVCAIILSLNVLATVAIARDSISESMQRRIQFLLVWILPLIGALMVLAVLRQAERPSRKYLERKSPEDEVSGADIVGTIGDGGSSD